VKVSVQLEHVAVSRPLLQISGENVPAASLRWAEGTSTIALEVLLDGTAWSCQPRSDVADTDNDEAANRRADKMNAFIVQA